MECHTLVERVIGAPEFAGKLRALGKGDIVSLDHVTPEANGFAVALIAARARQMRRPLLTCLPPTRMEQVAVPLDLIVQQRRFGCRVAGQLRATVQEILRFTRRQADVERGYALVGEGNFLSRQYLVLLHTTSAG